MCYNSIMKSKNKRCPRCEFKVPSEMAVCPRCQLNYQKFEKATNNEAKLAFQLGESERVLYRKGCPSDVSKVKLLLITIFLGFLGGHYYYVGRTKMGIFFSIFAFVGIVNGLLTFFLKSTPTGDLYQIFYVLVLVWGVVIMLWIVDIAKVCFNRFKIPVSLEK